MKKSKIRPAVLFFTGAVIAIGLIVYAMTTEKDSRRNVNLDPGGYVNEPSGVAYDPDRDSLIVVGDEGQIVELSLEGDLLRTTAFTGDFEGVALDSSNGLLYVLEESGEAILILSLSDFELRGQLSLSGIVEAAGLPQDRNDGFEGIAFESGEGAGNAVLWLGHQHSPAALIQVRISQDSDRLEYIRMLETPLREVSGLGFQRGRNALVVVSDPEDLYAVMSMDGEILETHPLPGIDQEGIEVLPGGRLVVTDDAGGVFLLPPEKAGVDLP